MNFKNIYVIIFLVLGVVFTDCQKYPDGPTASLRSRKARLTSSWRFSEAYRNQKNIYYGDGSSTINYNLSYIGFDDSNRFSYTYVYIDTLRPTLRGDGDWQFIDNNKKIELTYDSPAPDSTVQVFRVLRLEDKFLWLEETINDNTFELHLVPN